MSAIEPASRTDRRTVTGLSARPNVEPSEEPEVSPSEVDHDTGLEVEGTDDLATIERPFDPRKIKVRTITPVVDLILSRIRHGDIDLSPDFQRQAGIWNRERMSRLVESLLLRIPIPVFYVAADDDDRWSVVDGIQRITAIDSFVRGRFTLWRLEYLTQFETCDYDGLPHSMQRRIKETQLVVNVIEPGTPPEVMFNIFHRINTGGLPLNGQEIRNALHPGEVRDYLKNLATTQEFLDATSHSVKPDRMADRECVLRFLAFFDSSWNEYEDRDLDGYLSQAMRRINEMDDCERASLARTFTKAMRAAHCIFGNDAFRKRYDPEDSRKPVSKALFEAWSVGLAHRSRSEIDHLVEKREEVKLRFKKLLNEDTEFERAISLSTGQPSRVRKRFEAIDELIRACIP